ncbi:MAG: sulfatase [Rubinisphaera brasiliensis]|uniref:sulfatase family protein n=1 Tax=Rubinisphaera brasiliensis TaxID=119 RepID=UPI00391AE8F9
MRFPLMILALLLLAPGLAAAADTPNFVIVFTDDQGYADVGCFGAEGYETPNLDRMAQEGRKFTSFYVSQAVCSASRTSILTGCYNVRVGINGALSHKSTVGISADEMTLGELVKQQGYATAAVGKWHLGYQQKFLPLQHGFDRYFGLPYSNDMWPYHPRLEGMTLDEARKKGYPDLPLYSGNEIIDAQVTPEDQRQLTTRYTEQALDFIDDHHDKPFLLYLAHSMPHVPLFVSDKFQDKTEQGRYGDVIQEIDWSVGQVLARLKKHGLDDNTLVIFTSDNGPWLSYGNHAGSAGPFREGKGTSWEGGVRVPCIMRWPGKIPAGTSCDELAATIDIFPTVAALADAPLPEHTIDGKDIRSLMFESPCAKTPHDVYYFYWGSRLEAIRSGDWKLHFPHNYRSLTGEPGQDGKPAGYTQGKTDLALFNLKSDPGEQNDVKADHPQVVARLKALAEEAREELGDGGRKGSGAREVGRVN